MLLSQASSKSIGLRQNAGLCTQAAAPRMALTHRQVKAGQLGQQSSSLRRVSSLLARSQQPGGEGQGPSDEEEPPWVRREKERQVQAEQSAQKGFSLPWGLALLFSVFTTIAATGSIFEYTERNPLFGVVQPDSPFWAPILLFMAITGYPTAAFLFKYGVDGFNEYSEAMDRMDGFRK